MDNSSKLNSLDQYAQLIQLSKRIGFEVTKVVFRGYHTSSQLQRLHEQAVEKRTALKVKMEAEQQTQDLTDSKLLNEQQRNILRTFKCRTLTIFSRPLSFYKKHFEASIVPRSIPRFSQYFMLKVGDDEIALGTKLACSIENLHGRNLEMGAMLSATLSLRPLSAFDKLLMLLGD